MHAGDARASAFMGARRVGWGLTLQRGPMLASLKNARVTALQGKKFTGRKTRCVLLQASLTNERVTALQGRKGVRIG